MRPAWDLGVPDRVLDFYDTWPTLVKFLFWIFGGVFVFVIVAALFRVRELYEPASAVDRIERGYQRYIDDLEKQVNDIQKKKKSIEREREKNAEKRWENEQERKKVQDSLDNASVSDVDDLYERNRKRGGHG